MRYHGDMDVNAGYGSGVEQEAEASTALKVPITIDREPEGGYAVRSPALPELITEGATLGHAVEQIQDAVAAVLELYEDLGKPLPSGMTQGADTILYEVRFPS